MFPVSVPGPELQDEETEKWTIFTASLSAERVPLTVQQYRQKLMYLRKLEHSIIGALMPPGDFHDVSSLW